MTVAVLKGVENESIVGVDDFATDEARHYMRDCAGAIGNMLCCLFGGRDANGNVPPPNWENAHAWAKRAEGTYVRAMLAASGRWCLPEEYTDPESRRRDR